MYQYWFDTLTISNKYGFMFHGSRLTTVLQSSITAYYYSILAESSKLVCDPISKASY